MASLLDRKLIVITGKGGVGKTTVATAIGLVAARRGLRTIVVEVGEQHRLPGMFGVATDASTGHEVELAEGLWSTSIDPYRALLEWIETQVGGRVPARVLGSSSTFQYFVAAAPGASEVVTMAKVWELAQERRWRKRAYGYDLVVVDAPATGHALAMLRAPGTFVNIARVGPIATQAERVREFLDDPGYSSYLAVAQASEMAVAETLELEERLRHQLGRRLQAVVVNGVLPRRFTPAELAKLAKLADLGELGASGDGDDEGARGDVPAALAGSAARGDVPAALAGSAARAARTVHRRAGSQTGQLKRLRRHRFDVVSVPFVFQAELDLGAVLEISDILERKLL